MAPAGPSTSPLGQVVRLVVLALTVVSGAMALSAVHDVLVDDVSRVTKWLAVVQGAAAVLLVAYVLVRVAKSWASASGRTKLGLAVAGILGPLLVAALAVVGVAALLALAAMSSGSARQQGGATAAYTGPRFGSYWGTEAVVSDASGRPLSVGGQAVLFDGDIPIMVGSRAVVASRDGTVLMIGGEPVLHPGGSAQIMKVGDTWVT